MLPKKTMAMVQTGVRRIEPRDIPLPDIDADSALLQVEACGICGSDCEQYEGHLRTLPLALWVLEADPARVRR